MVAALVCAARVSSALDAPHGPVGTIDCDDCHIPHSAPGGAITRFSGNSNLCQSCHQPGGSGEDLTLLDAVQADRVGGTGSSHRWDADATNAALDTTLPSDAAMLLRIDDQGTLGDTSDDTIMCSTCHDQHNHTKGTPFMRRSPAGGALCAECHGAWDIADAGNGTWTGSALSHPAGIAYPASAVFHSQPLDADGSPQEAANEGTATGGSTTSLVDTSKTWGDLTGQVVRFTSGANAGVTAAATSMTGVTQVNFAALASPVAAGDAYEVDRDGNTTNNIALDNAGSWSYTTGNVECLSCHDLHYGDSNSTTAIADVGGGDGNLLRRANNDESCDGCHDVVIHNSNTTSTKYGTWGTAWTCRSCHTPHGSRNIYLLKETITTPNSGDLPVDFRNMNTGVEANGLVDSANPGRGPCEVCHTQTENSDATARFRNDGAGDGGKHYSTMCAGCHSHKTGFSAGESDGGVTCSGCHNDIWVRMNGSTTTSPGGQTIVSRHAIGNVAGTNDSPTDSGITWADPLGTTHAASARSCVNMCHSDHPHGAVTHTDSVHRDATDGTSRSATSGSTDFGGALTNGGMCLSCHRFSVDAAHPAVDKTAYDASAHDFTSNTVGVTTYDWTYTQHDGAVFQRNCTKCHTDPGDARPGDNTIPFGSVHFSSYDSLLAGATNPNGSPGTFICYECHGNGTTGTDRSGKDLATVFAKTYKHSVNSDNAHDSAAEAAVGYNDGTFSGANRHVNCLDCHGPHKAGNTLHSAPTNAIAATSPLVGVAGVQFSLYPGVWGTTSSASFTWTSGATKEYEICFKCHTSFAFGGTPPAGATDVAQEFNPNNYSGHPVVSGTNGHTGAQALTAGQLLAPWNTASRGTQAMMCSDCHNNDAGSPAAQGPHGSANAGIMKGGTYPYQADGTTLWSLFHFGDNPSTAPAGLLCLNCHPMVSGGNFINNAHEEHAGQGAWTASAMSCVVCHSAVPHGARRSRMIVYNGEPQPYDLDGPGAYVAGVLSGFRKASSPTGYGETDCVAAGSPPSSGDGCGTHSTGSGSYDP